MREVSYFSDGAASQKKFRQNFANLVNNKTILELLQSGISFPPVMVKVPVML
jgi:hypothetical protein